MLANDTTPPMGGEGKAVPNAAPQAAHPAPAVQSPLAAGPVLYASKAAERRARSWSAIAEREAVRLTDGTVVLDPRPARFARLLLPCTRCGKKTAREREVTGYAHERTRTRQLVTRVLCDPCAAWREDDVWEEWHAFDGLHADIYMLPDGDWDLPEVSAGDAAKAAA